MGFRLDWSFHSKLFEANALVTITSNNTVLSGRRFPLRLPQALNENIENEICRLQQHDKHQTIELQQGKAPNIGVRALRS